MKFDGPATTDPACSAWQKSPLLPKKREKKIFTLKGQLSNIVDVFSSSLLQ